MTKQSGKILDCFAALAITLLRFTMYLDELLSNCGEADDIPHVRLKGLCVDSRHVKPGDVFFALPGTQTDGIRFAAEAVKGGASAVVFESGEVLLNDVPVVRVKNIEKVLARAAAQFCGCPSHKFYLCGITGTNGKTTVTYLLEKIWGAHNSGVVGTINFRFAGRVFPATHTTPDALGLNRLFSQMAQTEVKRVAMEVSSHALEQGRSHGLDFDSAVFTNLTQDHLDYHGNMRAYFKSKLILFTEILPASTKNEKLAVIGLDDPYGRELHQVLKTLPVACETYAMNDGLADVHVIRSEYSLHGTQAEIQVQGQTRALRTNLLGEHNLKNIMAAVPVALHSGCEISHIIACVRDVSVPGRLERVGQSLCFVDYAHTPDALRNVLSSLRTVMKDDLKAGRLIVVFGCGGDRDRKKRPMMGRTAAELADVVIVTSDNPRTEKPQNIIADILPGVQEGKMSWKGVEGYLVEADRRKAIQKAVDVHRENDVVVVAGKGHEDYQIIGTEKIHFDDREILAELLT